MSEQATERWCAWCGESLPTSDRRRRFCNAWHAGQHQRDKYKENLLSRFHAGEDLTQAQFQLIQHKIDPRRSPRDPKTRYFGEMYA